MSTISAIAPTDRTAPHVRPLDRIDMYDPAATCRLLGVDEPALLRLVNSGALAAYDLGGAIRFCRADVNAVAAHARRARRCQSGPAA